MTEMYWKLRAMEAENALRVLCHHHTIKSLDDDQLFVCQACHYVLPWHSACDLMGDEV